jgi:glycosyltransferase involved in cell wall biosynthesis
MKILHIISSVNPAGGGPIEGVKQLGTTLVAAGHRVEIASLDAPEMPWVGECPLPVHALGPPHLGYAYSYRLIPWLRAHHNEYDAAVVNGIWQFHSFAAWRALHGSSTPYVLFTHGMLDPWFKRGYPLKHLKKWMYWPWAEYRVLRDAQAVLFTCESERILARDSFWLYRCHEKVVNYGTAQPKGNPQLELAQFYGRYPQLRGKQLALYMGRLHPKKGCDLLIEAFARVLAKGSYAKKDENETAEWHLVMAGPDQVGLRAQLSQQAERLGIAGRITWTGMIAGELKWGALRAAEIFVLPSHQENFGIVVAEALAAGVPALISNQVNIWREVEGDGAGLSADDTLPATCEMLQTYLDLSPEKKRTMRQAAHVCFEQRFEIQQAAQTLHAVLEQVARAA